MSLNSVSNISEFRGYKKSEKIGQDLITAKFLAQFGKNARIGSQSSGSLSNSISAGSLISQNLVE